ncbi:MAG TPA: hypothetical protein VF601_09060 [Beijerinckiaceae bacterium]|jgi:hypothetical protein
MTPPPSRREDLPVFLAVMAIVIGTIVLSGLLPAAPAPRAPSAAAFGDHDRSCAEWTDGCVVCRRDGHAAACSTPGIACTRGPVQCLKRTGG